MVYVAHAQSRDKAHGRLLALQSGSQVCQPTRICTAGTARCAPMFHSPWRPHPRRGDGAAGLREGCNQ
eukprot:6250283-Ditylum_brightwellii.AAC.1